MTQSFSTPSIGPQFSGQANAEAMQQVNKQFFSFEKVVSEDVIREQWEPLLCEIFPDENDREPVDVLVDRLRAGENFFLMRNAQGEPIGIELSQILPDQNASRDPALGNPMYVPWTGVLPEYRNHGIGSALHNEISRYMQETYGITHTLIDIEDPDRLHDSAYSAEELPEAIHNAQRRINFWRRQGFHVVHDDRENIDEQLLSYCRPASNDESEIQAYDHMCVKFHDDQFRSAKMTNNGAGIDIEFIRQCYVDMNAIQYDGASEQEMRSEYPAIEQYLTQIDTARVFGHERVMVMTSAVLQKPNSDNADIEIVQATSKAGSSQSAPHLNL